MRAGLSPQAEGGWEKWHLALGASADSAIVSVAILSMGNPHAVQEVADVEQAPVVVQGPLIEHHSRFPNRVNAGFMQVIDRSTVAPAGVGARRRRDAGLRHRRLRGGGGRHPAGPAGPQGRRAHARRPADHRMGRPGAQGPEPVLMTGPAVTVFEGEMEIPDSL